MSSLLSCSDSALLCIAGRWKDVWEDELCDVYAVQMM